MLILIESRFWWDYNNHGWTPAGYRNGTYLPLETIEDLLDQFNYRGFTDLCIYPELSEMAAYEDPSNKDTKGIYTVFPGHTVQNQTGK